MKKIRAVLTVSLVRNANAKVKLKKIALRA